MRKKAPHPSLSPRRGKNKEGVSFLTEILLRGESFAGNAAGISLLQKSFSVGRGQVNEELQDMENIGNPSPGGRGKGEGSFSRHHGKTDQQSEKEGVSFLTEILLRGKFS